ncbi:MAG: hypothetical protein NTZ33_06390 [Bacteroidetes bacterium]|nr:hypothetical protein [Bacteroidota bacterium]
MSEYTAQNAIVKQWKNLVQRELKTSLGQFTNGKQGMVQRKGRMEDKLANSLKGSIHLDYNLADGVSFKFERHGIFIHKGVGKGYKSTNGMVIKYSKNPSGHRNAAEWFNPIMEHTVPELADKLAVVNADAAVNATRMKII